jgi:IS66 Orf2 like protein
MNWLPSSVSIYLCEAPVDMRKGFDGLAALVRNTLGMDPLGGDSFSSSPKETTGSRSYSGTATDTPFSISVWRKAVLSGPVPPRVPRVRRTLPWLRTR